MKLLILFFSLIHALTPKLCIHCIHFITDGACGPEFGKCRILPITHVDENYLVTGVKTVKRIIIIVLLQDNMNTCAEKRENESNKYGMD